MVYLTYQWRSSSTRPNRRTTAPNTGLISSRRKPYGATRTGSNLPRAPIPSRGPSSSDALTERYGPALSRNARQKRSGSSRVAARATRKSGATISSEELDRKFDAGEDITQYLDLANATRPGRNTFKVNVDFPVDLLRKIDAEAARIGIARQAWIKLRLADVLDGVGNGAGAGAEGGRS
jgi:hypothetical protein